MNVRVYIGCIGSGKSFMAEKETDIQLAFADALREDVWDMLGWRPKTQEEYEEFKEQKWKLPGDRLYYFTGRDILQRYGTDIRRKEDPDYWAKKLVDKLILFNSIDTPLYPGKLPPNKCSIGITDCRFENEIIHLIKFSDKHFVPLTFVHTDYKSDRYDAKSEHPSEKIAQQFVGFTGSQEEFNKLIWDKYGKWNKYGR